MRNAKRVLFVAILLFALLPGQALACIISFKPTTVTSGADGKARVVVVIEWEHRNCELDDDEVNVDLVGLKKLASTGWVKVRSGLFENTIDLQLTGESGNVRVWRECSKKGLSEASVTVQR